MGVYVIGIAAIVALAYRDLKNGAVDSWPDVLIFAIWALIPWWITAGIAVRLEWGPREIASRFRASRR